MHARASNRPRLTPPRPVNQTSSTHILEGEFAVANREQKGNREKRKPKAEKPKSPVQASPFARPQPTVGAKKKK
jgi:hypothetical protein